MKQKMSKNQTFYQAKLIPPPAVRMSLTKPAVSRNNKLDQSGKQNEISVVTEK